MNVIEVKNLCKNYGDTQVLNNISFNVKSGEFVAIMGQSGSGKSTLLYCISGMDNISSGSVLFNGEDLSLATIKNMQKIRLSNMGFIFQKTNFLRNLSIADNIVYPAFQLNKIERKRIVKEAKLLMKNLSIDNIASRDVTKVSGGQLQRAAICRAMINHPKVLFGDEPTGSLNSSTTAEVMMLLKDINRKGTTILLVTHDSKVAMFADRVLYLEDGRIKDVLELGKYNSQNKDLREQNMEKWLKQMNF